MEALIYIKSNGRNNSSRKTGIIDLIKFYSFAALLRMFMLKNAKKKQFN